MFFHASMKIMTFCPWHHKESGAKQAVTKNDSCNAADELYVYFCDTIRSGPVLFCFQCVSGNRTVYPECDFCEKD